MMIFLIFSKLLNLMLSTFLKEESLTAGEIKAKVNEGGGLSDIGGCI